MGAIDVALVMFGGLAPATLGLALLAVQRMLADRSEPHSDVAQTGIAVVAWALITIGVLAELFVFSGPPGAAIGAIVIAMTAHRVRRAQQHGLVSLLAATAQRMMPLVPAIEAYSQQHAGTMGVRARYLADLLREGYSLPDALAQCGGVVPREALPLIRAGYESGALAAGLHSAADTRRFGDAIWNQVLTRATYLTVLLAVFLGIALFMIMKIAPAMQKIFADFEIELPPATRLVIGLGDATVSYGFLLFPFVLLLAVVAGYSLLRYVGWFPWRLPGTGFAFRRLDTAAVLEALGLVAERRRPMTDGLASLAKSFPAASVRIRLWRVVREIEQGADWAESLRRHALIREPEMAVIQAAQRVGNLPWALRELADSNRRRWGYRALIWLQILFPAVILSVGLLVALYVIGYFLPLVSLIQNLT
ncbi:MAG: hypothetical protein GXY83_08405 [Rhodopirellula sp.]|nr:hypothetical protein [Rhodopirellula sp.]